MREQLYRRMTGDKRDGGMGLSTTTAHHLHSIIHRALAKANALLPSGERRPG